MATPPAMLAAGHCFAAVVYFFFIYAA